MAFNSFHHSGLVQILYIDKFDLVQTAIMAATDIISTYRDEIVPVLNVGGMEKPANSLLSQLLLKASSNDKKFVIDEAKAALRAMSSNLAPLKLLTHILPQTQHKNPKVRYTPWRLMESTRAGKVWAYIVGV